MTAALRKELGKTIRHRPPLSAENTYWLLGRIKLEVTSFPGGIEAENLMNLGAGSNVVERQCRLRPNPLYLCEGTLKNGGPYREGPLKGKFIRE